MIGVANRKPYSPFPFKKRKNASRWDPEKERGPRGKYRLLSISLGVVATRAFQMSSARPPIAWRFWLAALRGNPSPAPLVKKSRRGSGHYTRGRHTPNRMESTSRPPAVRADYTNEKGGIWGRPPFPPRRTFSCASGRFWQAGPSIPAALHFPGDVPPAYTAVSSTA